VSQDTAPTPASGRAPGDIAVAALLALGAMIEGLRDIRLRGYRAYRLRGYHAYRAWLTAVPIVLVNVVAFYGQFSYLHAHKSVPPAVQVIVAVALESVAIYLAWQAHLAQLANDSALRLRLSSYLIALVIAAMNYSHFCGPGWRPAFLAVAFALASAISPVLWSVYSRRATRDALKARGLIEGRAVRLGATRWAWHPVKSFRVMSRATWAGETNPARAIALIEAGPGREIVIADRDATALVPWPAAEQPPSAPVSAPREPRAVRVREARAPELAAARDAAELALARQLAAMPAPWPGEQKLGRDTGLGRRKARRAIDLARTMSNGSHDGDGHRA
jgi:hypothetical protein